jgi:O-antigen ligase
MYCALTGTRIDSGWVLHHGTYTGAGFGFGVFNGAHLCAGIHYNVTGMSALCCTMFSLAGLCRSKNSIMRFAYLLATVFMVILVVLTQSRTARYALIVSLAAGVYGWFVARGFIRRRWLSHAAGLAAAALLLVCAYQGASMLTSAALRHYAQSDETAQIPFVSAAIAQEEAAAAPAKEGKQARKAVDATLSGRTDIWRNLFKLWKENPKYLLIGNGIGRTGSQIVAGTIHERNGAVAVHNTYLQFIADFGLIGFGFMAAFLALLAAPVVRSLFSAGSQGYRPLGMLVIAALMTGMMESAPLGAMTPMNMALFFVLALIAGRSRDVRALVQ